MKRGWHGTEYGGIRIYEKDTRLELLETGGKYRAKIIINLFSEGNKDDIVKSFRIEKDALEYHEIPGARYSTMVSEHLGRITRPMRENEVKEFLRTILFELEDFPEAKVKGRCVGKEYLTDLRLKITADEMERYQNEAFKNLGNDWKLYRQIEAKKDLRDERERSRQSSS
jgi:hypothetical protein